MVNAKVMTPLFPGFDSPYCHFFEKKNIMTQVNLIAGSATVKSYNQSPSKSHPLTRTETHFESLDIIVGLSRWIIST